MTEIADQGCIPRLPIGFAFIGSRSNLIEDGEMIENEFERV